MQLWSLRAMEAGADTNFSGGSLFLLAKTSALAGGTAKQVLMSYCTKSHTCPKECVALNTNARKSLVFYDHYRIGSKRNCSW